MDRFRFVIVVAALGCFALAFALSGIYPWWVTDAKGHEATVIEVTDVVSPDFKDVKERWPVAFDRAFDGASEALTDKQLAGIPTDDPRRLSSASAWKSAYADAVKRGRDRYVAEACWHCHSQYVRPVIGDTARFGRIRSTDDDNNVLQRPVLWGTRRVGPDLTNEGGLRSNDWHAAHFADPASVSPGSVMPKYPWYFEDGWEVRRTISKDVAKREGVDPATSYPYPGVHRTKAEAEAAMESIRASIPPVLEGEKTRLFVSPAKSPTADGLALIAYMQWLGTWTAPTRGN